MAIVLNALFFVVQITPTFFVAYFFTVVALIMFCGGNLYMLNNPKSYPWFTAFPLVIWRYLLMQLALSTIFVLRDNIFPGSFPIGLFLFLHIALLGFFAVFLILMKGGKEIIETKDAEIKQKVSVIRLMQADVESILRKNAEHEKPLRKVIEALKYSDPMNHSAVDFYEQQIQRSIFEMASLNGNDSAKIPEICEKLLNFIADRNSRILIMK